MIDRLQLTPTTLPQPIPGTGIELVSTGLQGELVCYSAEDAGPTRASELTGAPMRSEALDEAGLQIAHLLEINAPTPKDNSDSPAVRAGAEPPAQELRLDINPERADVLFAVYEDEASVMSLHWPERPKEPLPAGMRGPRPKAITIRLRPEPPTSDGTRGAGTDLARKLITLVIRAAGKPMVGAIEFAAVKMWEDKMRRFEGLHRGTSDEFFAEQPIEAESDYLRRLAGQPALLFVHGTTSSTRGAFASLRDFPPEAKALWARYDGRVLGFNHHTMSKSVAENVVDFYRTLPAGKTYVFDAIVHSRGGLVARAIAGLADEKVTEFAKLGSTWRRTANVQIRRIVFVGTPNNGTDLADPNNLPTALNWLSNIADVFPTSATGVTLGAVFAIAAYVGETGLTVLPGLADQALFKGGGTAPLLKALNQSGNCDHAFSVASHFRPSGRLLAAALAFAIDAAFRGAYNDLVVPSEGISTFGPNRFRADRIKSFGTDTHPPVHHMSYFGSPDTWRHILASLS